MEITMSRRDLVRGLAAGTVLPFATSGCVTNAATGRSQLMLVSQGQLAQLSASAWSEVKKDTPVSIDPTLNHQLRRVGNRIAKGANRSNESWEYAVFDTDEKNAFVMPGGKVGFYRGIMEFSENDDQIAAIMGHETGHVTARHAAERYSQQIAAGVGLQVANVALSQRDSRYRKEIAAILGVGVQFGIILPFSRQHELEADKLGVDYMYRSGYDVRQAVRLWERMGAEGSSKRPPELLSTHPSPRTRVRALDAYIRQRGYV
jgi:predicted Zn-dependent protease